MQGGGVGYPTDPRPTVEALAHVGGAVCYASHDTGMVVDLVRVDWVYLVFSRERAQSAAIRHVAIVDVVIELRQRYGHDA